MAQGTLLTIGLFVVSAILIPAVVAGMRYRKRQEDAAKLQDERLVKLEAELGFLRAYLLKNAVLEFHNNPNPKTDNIIEKINSDEPLTVDEMKQLEAKLVGIIEQTDDKKKELRAKNTLDLIRHLEELGSVAARARARDDLFNE